MLAEMEMDGRDWMGVGRRSRGGEARSERENLLFCLGLVVRGTRARRLCSAAGRDSHAPTADGDECTAGSSFTRSWSDQPCPMLSRSRMLDGTGADRTDAEFAM